jgi:hypothetical protein
MTRAESMSRITQTITEARARCVVTPERQAELVSDKEQLLERGLVVMMSNDYAARELWLNEYASLCRVIHENEHDLEQAA